jgi:type I restriction enzyme, R subunit
LKEKWKDLEKTTFLLFDFFGNCEYFEEKYDYDQTIKLPPLTGSFEKGGGDPPPPPLSYAEIFDLDKIRSYQVQDVGAEGMKVDRMFFEKFEDETTRHKEVRRLMEEGNTAAAAGVVRREIFDKPEEYFNLEKLRKALDVDWRIDLTELLDYIFTSEKDGRRIPGKNDLLDDEFAKFIADFKPGSEDDIIALKYFFKAYITDGALRNIIEEKRFTDLNVNPSFTIKDFKAVGKK